jgi:hypothetical protein
MDGRLFFARPERFPGLPDRAIRRRESRSPDRRPANVGAEAGAAVGARVIDDVETDVGAIVGGRIDADLNADVLADFVDLPSRPPRALRETSLQVIYHSPYPILDQFNIKVDQQSQP